MKHQHGVLRLRIFRVTRIGEAVTRSHFDHANKHLVYTAWSSPPTTSSLVPAMTLSRFGVNVLVDVLGPLGSRMEVIAKVTMEVFFA
jgi:hypothetical protein